MSEGKGADGRKVHKVMQDSDIALAEDLVEQDKVEHKIVELPFVVESETLEARIEGKYRTISIKVGLHNIIVTEALDLSSAWLDFPLVAWKCSRMFQFLYGRIIAVLNHVTTVSRFKMLRVINITNICYQNLTLVFTLYEKQDFTPGKEYSYIVDVDPSSFDEPHVVEAIDLSKTIFVNAVMGLMPHFWHGTYKMDEMIDCNRSAQKFFGGGDTLQEFKRW